MAAGVEKIAKQITRIVRVSVVIEVCPGGYHTLTEEVHLYQYGNGGRIPWKAFWGSGY